MKKKLPKIITQEEFEELFKAVLKLEQKASKKRKLRLRQYRLAMLLGFEAGLRISEIVGYKGISRRTNKKTGEVVVSDIEILPLAKSNVEGPSIRIIGGKGGKDRIVPRPKRMLEHGVAMLPLKIKRRALQAFTTELGQKVLNKEITFHTLRHGFGSALAGAGRPLHEIQMLMGHSRLDTTGIYLHANPKQAIEGAREVF